MNYDVATAAPKRRNARTKPRAIEKPFIAWDGEGDSRRNTYILFGASTGDYVQAPSLVATECFQIMMKVVQHNPHAIHVAYAFDYDVSMMTRSLPEKRREQLVKDGVTYFNKWRIEWRPKKWFSVWDRETKLSIRIYDIFSFFVSSAIKAWSAYLPDEEIRPEVTAGKEERQFFRYENVDTIREYMFYELELYRKLAERLRYLISQLDIVPQGWYGPGAVASAFFKLKGIRHAMDQDLPGGVIDAAAMAYFGGRFEQFYCGQYEGPVYATDRRSAYPYALSQVPWLSGGKWEHRALPAADAAGHYNDFTLLRVRYEKGPADDAHWSPAPFPYRDRRGLLSWPNHVEGWYWGVEVNAAIDGLNVGDRIEVLEEWHFTPATDAKPFAMIGPLFKQRMKWKDEENPVEYAAKLVLNSMYGKLAQRIGWDEEKRTAPRWHQLEWSGFITAHCRAGIYRAMCTRPGSIIAVETDGIFSTEPLDVPPDNKELGDWEVAQRDGIIYVQSGMYWWLKDGEWVKQKIRGFASGDITTEEVVKRLKGLKPLRARTHRFAGLKAFWSKPDKLGTWIDAEPLAMWGGGGESKRTHYDKMCPKCLGAPVALHHLIISRPLGGVSTPHHLPWRDHETTAHVQPLERTRSRTARARRLLSTMRRTLPSISS